MDQGCRSERPFRDGLVRVDQAVLDEELVERRRGWRKAHGFGTTVVVNGKEASNEFQLTRRGSAFGVSPP
jgi:hypothetical protein